MPRFTFTARDASGRSQQGTLDAASPSAAVDALRRRGWIVLQVRPEATPSRDVGADLLMRIGWKPVRSVDVELSLQQLAVMLRGGLTLLDALTTLARQAERRSVRQVWRTVADALQEGASLGEAMQRHRCFSPMVVQLVRVGEQTGQLETVLVQAADALEQRRGLRATLVSALLYPAVVLVAAFGVTAFMILSVVPKLQIFLKALGKKLPPMTQVLIDISDFCRTSWPQMLTGLLTFVAAAVALYAWPGGRLWVDRMLLRLPLLGRVLRIAATVTFARGLGLLLESGITLLESLRTVERLHRNRHLANCVARARETVLHGGNLAEPLGAHHAFMPLLSCMVAVGESAGTLDDVLSEVAKFHQAQLQVTIRRLSSLLEPAITVVVGGVVGYVYISFFVAMFAAGS